MSVYAGEHRGAGERSQRLSPGRQTFRRRAAGRGAHVQALVFANETALFQIRL